MKKWILALGIIAGIGISKSNWAQRPNQKIKIGTIAPEIALPNPDGDTIKLSEVNKKAYVIVDFWASWCGPCRRANPTLVELMQKVEGVKLKDAKNGIQVYSVSLDRNKDAWLKGKETDNLFWNNHVSDLKFWDSEAAADWGVTYIPQVFLINPEGEVIGHYANIHALKNDIEKLLKENNKKRKK